MIRQRIFAQMLSKVRLLVANEYPFSVQSDCRIFVSTLLDDLHFLCEDLSTVNMS